MPVWLALYMAVASGQETILSDEDGPTRFKTRSECRSHAARVAHKMGDILRDKFIVAEDIAVYWKCIKSEGLR